MVVYLVAAKSSFLDALGHRFNDSTHEPLTDKCWRRGSEEIQIGFARIDHVLKTIRNHMSSDESQRHKKKGGLAVGK